MEQATMTIDEEIASVEREIKMRLRVYPRWVSDGKLSQAKADHELAAMRAVLETLQAVKNNDAAHLNRVNAAPVNTNMTLGL